MILKLERLFGNAQARATGLWQRLILCAIVGYTFGLIVYWWWLPEKEKAPVVRLALPIGTAVAACIGGAILMFAERYCGRTLADVYVGSRAKSSVSILAVAIVILVAAAIIVCLFFLLFFVFL